MRLALLACAAAGCVSPYQSARVLAPGKTQATVSVTQVRSIEDSDDKLWVGDVQVRHGFDGKLEGGIRLGSAPSNDDTANQIFVDVKAKLSQTDTTAVSVALPVGIYFGQRGFDFEDGTIAIAPVLFFGAQLSPEAELVVAPRVAYLIPDNDDNETALGVSLGVRFGPPSTGWAIHPEVGIMKLMADGTDPLITFGIGIAAGN